MANSDSKEEKVLDLNHKKKALTGYLKDFKIMDDSDRENIMNLIDVYIANRDDPEAKVKAYQDIVLKLGEVLSKPENYIPGDDMDARTTQIVEAVNDIADTVDSSPKPRPKP